MVLEESAIASKDPVVWDLLINKVQEIWDPMDLRALQVLVPVLSEWVQVNKALLVLDQINKVQGVWGLAKEDQVF